MSGGYFNYAQYQINDIIDSIERKLNSQGVEKDKCHLYMDDDYYVKHPEEKYNTIYPTEIQERMKEGIEALKRAIVYTQRIDWFLSGDDGDENFIKRLDEELSKLNNN